MPSNQSWNSWDLYPLIKKGGAKISGINLFSFPDPFIERIFLDQIKAHYPELKIVLGSEVNLDWISESFNTYSLFGETSSYLVIGAENIDKNRWNDLLELSLSGSGQSLVLIFGEDSELFDKWQSRDAVTSYHISPPRFWEYKRVLNLFLVHFEIGLEFKAEEYFMELVNPTTEEYFSETSKLAITFPKKKQIARKEIEGKLAISNYRYFEIATVLSKKQISKFYEEVIKLSLGSDELESLFIFMVGHLYKLYDPSYIKNKKGNISKYDREIESLSKGWKREELLGIINNFREILISLRLQRATSKNLIYQKHLESMQ